MKLLRSRNPDTGYIVTANNKIAGDDYPHYISLYYGSDDRARRILGRVRVLTDATVEDMADVHGDIVSIPDSCVRGAARPRSSRKTRRRGGARCGICPAGTARCTRTSSRPRYTARSGASWTGGS